MRRCYAHVPAAENPLRPETPKSPWSRRIVFPAPSGHFRIVLFLIGCLVWFLGLLIDGRFFFVLYPASVSYGFVLRFSSGAYAFRLFFLSFAFRWLLGRLRFSSSVFPLGGSCRSSVPRFPLSICPHPFHGFVFPPPFPFLIRFPFSGFPFVFVFPLSVLFPRVACVFLSVSWISISVRPFRLRSPIPPLRITSSQCAIGRRRRAYRPRSSASSRTASSRVAWRRWSR